MRPTGTEGRLRLLSRHIIPIPRNSDAGSAVPGTPSADRPTPPGPESVVSWLPPAKWVISAVTPLCAVEANRSGPYGSRPLQLAQLFGAAFLRSGPVAEGRSSPLGRYWRTASARPHVTVTFRRGPDVWRRRLGQSLYFTIRGCQPPGDIGLDGDGRSLHPHSPTRFSVPPSGPGVSRLRRRRWPPAGRLWSLPGPRAGVEGPNRDPSRSLASDSRGRRAAPSSSLVVVSTRACRKADTILL